MPAAHEGYEIASGDVTARARKVIQARRRREGRIRTQGSHCDFSVLRTDVVDGCDAELVRYPGRQPADEQRQVGERHEAAVALGVQLLHELRALRHGQLLLQRKTHFLRGTCGEV